MVGTWRMVSTLDHFCWKIRGLWLRFNWPLELYTWVIRICVSGSCYRMSGVNHPAVVTTTLSSSYHLKFIQTPRAPLSSQIVLRRKDSMMKKLQAFRVVESFKSNQDTCAQNRLSYGPYTTGKGGKHSAKRFDLLLQLPSFSARY